jgi:DMSO/TMAO reductase YedYZ heme-binding membrane subunit
MNCISCSAMIYALILVNEIDCSFCSDEVKKMKRDFQWRVMSQVFVQCFAFMIYIHYLVFGKFDQGGDLLYACLTVAVLIWECLTVAVLILELIKMKIGYDYDANEQITSSQDLHY